MAIIVGIYLKRNIPLCILLVKTLKQSKERERKEQEEYEKRRQFEEQYKKERDAKITKMTAKSYEQVFGLSDQSGDLWIQRENGRIVALYNLDEKRIPLAELTQSSYTQVIGNVPEIWYNKKDHITSRELSQDDWEVRKVNGVARPLLHIVEQLKEPVEIGGELITLLKL